MRLARIVGTVVSTIKASGLAGFKLLLVSDLDAANPDAAATSQIYVAVDQVGAGEGEVVLVAQGSAARVNESDRAIPIDAAVIAIVDTIVEQSRTTYEKS